VSAPSSAAPSLEQRIAALEAVEAIRSMKARYAALADQKYTADYRRVDADEMRRIARLQAECFTDDAIWHGGSEFGASLIGRDALTQWFNRSPWCFAVHYYGSPQLTVTGDTAHGQWRLWQIALRDDTHDAVLLAAVTSETYARAGDGQWLHASMRFEQVHMLPVGDAPYPLRSSFTAATASVPPQPSPEAPHV
jgi:hypothetical protein